MRSKALAIGLAAVLGVVGGVVTAFAMSRHVDDPLHLGTALANQPCQEGKSVVILHGGPPNSLLSSAVASNRGARYLRTAASCHTVWRYQAPDDTSVRPDPEYVVYLGPYATNSACAIRMQGEHQGDVVTMLSSTSTRTVQCICHVDQATAPTLRPGMSPDEREVIWIRQLQDVFRDAHLLTDITGVYDQATQDVVRTEQTRLGLPATGFVNQRTWSRILKLCRNYA